MKTFLFSLFALMHFNLICGHFEHTWENHLEGKTFGTAALSKDEDILAISFTKPEEIDPNEGASEAYKSDICCIAEYVASKGNFLRESYHKKIDPINGKSYSEQVFTQHWKTHNPHIYRNCSINETSLGSSPCNFSYRSEGESIQITMNNQIAHEWENTSKRIFTARCPQEKISATATENKIYLRDIEKQTIFQELEICTDAGLVKMVFFFENNTGLHLSIVYENKVVVYAYQAVNPLKPAKNFYRNPLQ